MTRYASTAYVPKHKKGLTPGKPYLVVDDPEEREQIYCDIFGIDSEPFMWEGDPKAFIIKDDDGDALFCLSSGCAQISGRDWEITECL